MAVDKPLHLYGDTRSMRLLNYTAPTMYVDFLATSGDGLTITPQSTGLVTITTTGGLSLTGPIAFDSAVASNIVWGGDTNLYRTAANRLATDDALAVGVSINVANTSTTNLGSGDVRAAGAYWLVDGMTAPTTTTGYAVIYVDTADGDLKVKFADGVTQVLAADTT